MRPGAGSLTAGSGSSSANGTSASRRSAAAARAHTGEASTWLRFTDEEREALASTVQQLGGESFQDIQDRMVSFWHDLVATNHQNIIVCSHGDPLYGDLQYRPAFYATVFGWTFVDYGPDYCSFNDGQLDGGFYRADLQASTASGSARVASARASEPAPDSVRASDSPGVSNVSRCAAT